MILKEHLRLFGVYSNISKKLLFHSKTYSSCQHFIQSLGNPSTMEIIRFDANLTHTPKN